MYTSLLLCRIFSKFLHMQAALSAGMIIAINKSGGVMLKGVWKVTRFLLLPFLFYGCGGTTIKYLNPTANFSYIKKVAVVPFSNFSDDRYAGEKVRNALTVELLSRHAFDVIEHGEVSKALNLIREGGFEESKNIQMDKETVKMVGGKLGVQALLMGAVNDYSGGRGGFAHNVVSISVKMIDTESGTVLWQASTSKVGGGVVRKMLGLEDVDMNILTNRAVKTVLDTLL